MRATIAIILVGLAVTACSANSQPAPPASSTPAPTSATGRSGRLSTSWIPNLQRLALNSCRGADAFSTGCLTDSLKLKDAAAELGSEASLRVDTAVKAKAAQVEADLQRYSNDCVTSKPGSSQRLQCASLPVHLPSLHEDLIAAIHESEDK